MQCPRCHAEVVPGFWRSRVRRKDKVVWIRAHCWQCSCRTPTGPFSFTTPEQEDQNEALAAAVWRENFSEDMPPPLVGVRLRRLMRTSEGKARVAAAFGRVLQHQITERTP